MQFKRHKSQFACVYKLFEIGRKHIIEEFERNWYGSGDKLRGLSDPEIPILWSFQGHWKVWGKSWTAFTGFGVYTALSEGLFVILISAQLLKPCVGQANLKIIKNYSVFIVFYFFLPSII